MRISRTAAGGPAWLATTALLALTTLGACGRVEGAEPGKPSVVAAFYPLQFVAERVGGDAVTVASLATPGAEPHDLEMSAGQVRQIADAALVVYLRGFQPEVDETVQQQASESSIDVGAVQPLLDAPAGAGGTHGGEEPQTEPSRAAKDLHVWLDPTRLAAIGGRLADRLAALVPDRAGDFRSRAAALSTDLETLDREYRDALSTCQRHEIVTSHTAFGYLARRYGLRQIPISGLSAEVEPTPAHMAEVAEQARSLGVTTIFFETLVSPRVAETLAREVGAKAEVLDPIEGLTPGAAGDYLSVMRENLGRLRAALACP